MKNRLTIMTAGLVLAFSASSAVFAATVSYVGNMDATQMSKMIKDCKTKKKDGKACEKEAMSKCQKSPNKAECDKLMKEAKAGDATTKNK